MEWAAEVAGAAVAAAAAESGASEVLSGGAVEPACPS